MATLEASLTCHSLASLNVRDEGSLAAPLSEETYSADLAGCLPQIARMREQLLQTSTHIEESIVGVCDSFQGMAGRARATVARTAGLMGRDREGDDGRKSFEALLKTCGETLVNIMQATADAGEISRRAIERIEQMDQASQQITQCLGHLDEIARGNRMLSFNARIEAAHAGSEGRGFAVVAVELATQTTRSMALTAKVGELSMNLRVLADSTLKDLRRMNEQDSQRVNECRLQVDTSLGDLETAHGEMAEMLNGMTTESASLANDIGAAVRSLQFQDRTSQRIGHVVEGLDALNARLARQIGHGRNVIAPEAAADEDFRIYTMQEERAVAGLAGMEAPAGDVELF